ncbi:MAG: hypothetical protein QMD85_01235 [Candidatus Aenigmarchaeota archaeon]|nr:hypothetical protein [Candidatus Aenigmarchaeota archaeon]
MLSLSGRWGNNLEFTGYSDTYDTERNQRIFVQRYLDDEGNSIYVGYDEGGTETEIQITQDYNENDVIDGNEIGLELISNDGDPEGVEYIGLNLSEISNHRHLLSRDTKASGNESRFEKADELFRKILGQTPMKEYEEMDIEEEGYEGNHI